MTGKIEVYVEGGNHKVLTYFTEDDVEVGDKVSILGGILKGKKGTVYSTTSSYEGYLFEVKKLNPIHELAAIVEDTANSLNCLAEKLYKL